MEKRQSCCMTTSCHVTTGIIGILLMVGGCVMIGVDVATTIIDSVMSKQLILSLDSPVFDQWMNPAPPIYMQYWFFNVTNPQAVLNGSEKAKVKEVGPLTYRLYQPRMDVAFYTNDTVSYKYNHTLVFQPHMSAVKQTQNITQLNLPLITVDAMLRNRSLSTLVKDMIKGAVAALGDSDLFVIHTMDEFLFGYNDPLFHTLGPILSDLGINFPSQFGIFYQFNNSDDGVYLAKTGRSDIAQANVLERWNGESNLSYWGTNQTNMINGTDGIFMTPRVNESQQLYLYNSDICRSIYLEFEQYSQVMGIDTMRFTVPAQVFESPDTNKNNAGFCLTPTCLRDGVLEIATCKQGAPIVMSCPHFYLGDPSYQVGVVGLHPNKQDHQTYIDVEPMSGAVFKGDKRLQANVLLQRSDIFTQLAHLSETIFPILWLNESVTLDDGTAHTFKTEVVTVVGFVHALPYLLLSIGVLLVLVSIGLLARRRYVEQGFVKLIDDDDSTKSTVDG